MKKSTLLRSLTYILVLISSVCISRAAEVSFTYDQLGDKRSGYGFGTEGSYDVCIKVDNPELTGGLISGIRFRIPNERGGSVDKIAMAWLSSELPQYPLNIPELIACKNVDILEEGTTISATSISGETTEVFVKFENPVVMPAGGLYAGYSLSVLTLPQSPRKYPVETVPGEITGGLYMRSDLRTSWVDVTFSMMKMSTMEVVFDREVGENSAGIEVVGTPKTKIDEGGFANAKIFNYGSSPLTNISYTTTISGKRVDANFTFEPTIETRYGTYSEVRLPIPPADVLGEEEAIISITEVNGHPNEAAVSECRVNVMTWPEIPVKRPMVEEFTGLWCGACPSGYVALEQGRDEIGSDFVAVAYHLNDLIETNVSYPRRPASLPDASIDRKYTIAPSSILQEWRSHSLEDTDASINVDAYWKDNSKTKLYADVEAVFMTEHKKSNYELCYVVVADGLMSDYWVQTNYFSGTVQGGKYWDLFTKGGAYVYDLKFNNIPVVAESAFGIDGSLPDDIEQYKIYRKQFVIDITKASTVFGGEIVQNPDKLRFIAYIYDTVNGKIENAVSSGYPVIKVSGVNGISTDADKQQTQVRYYSLQGIELIEAPLDTPYIEQSASGARIRINH